ncbi:E3 SUMO-protein ligase pli1 [Coemansia sp. RSA 2336]|nr:E3 SUMO-protein ligase pli1 [Coemansia sp. RSA 2336]
MATKKNLNWEISVLEAQVGAGKSFWKAKAKVAKEQREKARKAKHTAGVTGQEAAISAEPSVASKEEAEARLAELRREKANRKLYVVRKHSKALVTKLVRFEKKRLLRKIKQHQSNLSEANAADNTEQAAIDECEKNIEATVALPIEDLTTCLMSRIKKRIAEDGLDIPPLSSELQEFNASKCVQRVLGAHQAIEFIKETATDLHEILTGTKRAAKKQELPQETKAAKSSTPEVSAAYDGYESTSDLEADRAGRKSEPASVFVSRLDGNDSDESVSNSRRKSKKDKRKRHDASEEDDLFMEIYQGKEVKKNRPGQRQRRKQYEQLYGDEANHIKIWKKEKKPSHSSRQHKQTIAEPAKETKPSNATASNKPQAMHPSWEAKRRERELLEQAKSIKGQKIDIPRHVLSTLQLKELKPALTYFNKMFPENSKTIHALKDVLIDSLWSVLTKLYDDERRNEYEKLLHFICALLRRPESVGVPSAVPGGLVNPQFQHSPAAPPARANSSYGSYAMTTGDIEKVVFCDHGLLMPKTSIVKPFSYSASPQRLQSKSISFKLTTDIIDLLQENGKDQAKELYGIHLYIANMATVCTERRLNANASAQLYMPYRLQLRVNGTLEPTLLHASGMYARPIDVTSLLQQKSDYTNRIDITYMSNPPLIIALMLTIQHTPQSLSAHIHKSSLASIEQVRTQFFKTQSDDDDIIDEGALINLKCPLGLSRIKAPCRAKQCQHLQCFDCVTFLQFYSKIAQWKCPVCSVAIKSWHDLIADSYFEDILQKTSESDEQVYIDPSGDWKLKKDAETLRSSNKERTSKRPLEVEDVDAIDLSAQGNSRDRGSSRNKQQRTDVIDLTLDSDEDSCEAVDDLPPMSQEELDMIDELETNRLFGRPVSSSMSDPQTIALPLTGQLTWPNSTCTACSSMVSSVRAESATAVSSSSSVTNSSARSASLSSTNASTATRSQATSTAAQNPSRSEQASNLQSAVQSPAQTAAAPAVSSPITPTPQRPTTRSSTGSSLAIRLTANGMAVSNAPGLQTATKSPARSRNASPNAARRGRGRGALSRRATSSGTIRAPTVTINTTVSGIDVTGDNARSIQQRMSSNAQSVPHTAIRQNASIVQQLSTPTRVRRGTDMHAANFWAGSSGALTSNSLPTSPIGMRSPTNSHQASAGNVSQLANGCTLTPCPVHSQRSPLVGISPTYSSLFLHSQANNASPGGNGSATRPNS